MLIIPAVDIKGGKCVRLYQGRPEEATVYSEDPAAMARRWEGEGASFLHVVDLDGALQGHPVNRQSVSAILRAVKIPLELGGGLRSLEDIESALSQGIERVIIGTKAAELSPTGKPQEPPRPGRGARVDGSLDFLEEAFREFRERAVPAVDARGGRVVVKGWTEETGLAAGKLGRLLKKIGFGLVIYTDTARDGTLGGVNLRAFEEFLDATGLAVIAAGGVTSPEDIRSLKALERKGLSGAIIGKALYAGRIDLQAAIREADK